MMSVKPHLLFVAAGLSVLVGCETQAPKDGTTIDLIQRELEKGQQQAETMPAVVPPPEISAALMPTLELDLGRGASELNRFDVRVSNAEAREFFMGLVEGTPYNMVVHPDVSGTITLSLKNVTIPEVMMTLRDVYGYEYSQNSAGFQVLPVRLQSRIFYVDYLTLQRSGKSEMSISGGSSGSSYDSTDTASSSSSNSSSSSIATNSQSDVWSELRQSLASIIGDGEGRSITVSPHAGIVVVRAMPSELREVESFLRETQASLQRQVILEAKIIEVQLDDGYEAGIDWNKIATADNGNRSIEFSQRSNNDLVNGPINATDGLFAVDIALRGFTAMIELLETQGNVQVLSSPRVATMNNQKAVIKVGQDQRFVTDVSSETVSSSGGNITNPEVTLTPFFTGIALDVTPQVDRAGNVTLHIHPSVTDVEEDEIQVTIDDQQQILPSALSKVREVDSIVRARNGQLIVIGGLMKELTSEELASVPGLGDLPFFGAAFRQTTQRSLKSELVILLRPTVIDSPQDWQESMTLSSDRYQSLDRGFHAGGKTEIFGNEGERQ
jgi:MSHA biogenesis protein MshL